MHVLTRMLACVACGFAFIVAVPLLGSTADAVAVDRGIVDHRLETAWGVDLAQVPAMAQEMGSRGLRAKWTRILVHWAKLQPLEPGTSSPDDKNGDGYADSYVEELHTVVDALLTQRIKVILTVTEVPEWASDRELWHHPPWASYGTGYSPIYAMDADDPAVLSQFGALGTFLAKSFGPSVRHFECWNEPNLGGSFYPQSRPGAPSFGLRIYVKMLRAFHSGVRRVTSQAVVIAGATSPRGANDDFSTMPATFAKYLRDHGAGRYFEGYSCHVYPWGAPGLTPSKPRSAVTLGNLDALIKYFPKKSFYVTEFGYSTEAPTQLGQTVSETDQARYLRQAYSLTARRYKQVKTILWFMVHDLDSIDGGVGISMGLKRVDGSLKPSWFAFAGGNALSLAAPAAVGSSAWFNLSGALTTRVPGASAGRGVQLQLRRPGQARWKQLSAVVTEPDGSFGFRVMQASGVWLYRVVWDGVCESSKATVRTP